MKKSKQINEAEYQRSCRLLHDAMFLEALRPFRTWLVPIQATMVMRKILGGWFGLFIFMVSHCAKQYADSTYAWVWLFWHYRVLRKTDQEIEKLIRLDLTEYANKESESDNIHLE